MINNYLKGNIGNSINANLATAEFNFKRLLRKIKEEFLWLKKLLKIFYNLYKYVISNFSL